MCLNLLIIKGIQHKEDASFSLKEQKAEASDQVHLTTLLFLDCKVYTKYTPFLRHPSLTKCPNVSS